MADPALDSLFSIAGSLKPMGNLEFILANFMLMSSVFPNSQGGLVWAPQGLSNALSGDMFPNSEEGSNNAMPAGKVTIQAPVLLPGSGKEGPHWSDYSLTVTSAGATQTLTPQAVGPISGLYFVFATWQDYTGITGEPGKPWTASVVMTIGTPFLANTPPQP